MKFNARPTLITGIDVGSSAVRIAVGQIVQQGNGQLLQILGCAEVPAEGIHKGIITSIDDAVSSVTACLERVERLAGAEIGRAVVGISGSHILSQQSKGVVAIAKSDGEITEDDVARAIEAARTVATPVNYEILHVIPKTFTVDGQGGIKDPTGMTGVRLEVDAQIIQGVSSQIKNMSRVVYRTGLEIDAMVLTILASADIVTTDRQKELGVAVVNIGAATTSIAVFEEGDVLHTAILPIGSEHITSDIAIGLRTSIDVAERVKVEYGTALPKMVGKKEEIFLAELGAAEQEVVDRKYVAEIIEARVEEIFRKIDKELRAIERSGLLPAGILFTGGGARLDGLVELAKKELRLPAALGYPMDITSLSEKVNDLAFTS
ncbi:MAG: cell division protein FtsA, partial [Candidatus Magasanikbacteria bacterium]|nr:cell division protein FtsA [Candidatus Magasanikbacteria bacterium]